MGEEEGVDGGRVVVIERGSWVLARCWKEMRRMSKLSGFGLRSRKVQ